MGKAGSTRCQSCTARAPAQSEGWDERRSTGATVLEGVQTATSDPSPAQTRYSLFSRREQSGQARRPPTTCTPTSGPGHRTRRWERCGGLGRRREKCLREHHLLYTRRARLLVAFESLLNRLSRAARCPPNETARSLPELGRCYKKHGLAQRERKKVTKR